MLDAEIHRQKSKTREGGRPRPRIADESDMESEDISEGSGSEHEQFPSLEEALEEFLEEVDGAEAAISQPASSSGRQAVEVREIDTLPSVDSVNAIACVQQEDTQPPEPKGSEGGGQVVRPRRQHGESWGPFHLIQKLTFGRLGYEATCPYHRGTDTAPKCKHFIGVSFVGEMPVCELKIKAWCIASQNYTRKRTHMRHKPAPGDLDGGELDRIRDVFLYLHIENGDPLKRLNHTCAKVISSFDALVPFSSFSTCSDVTRNVKRLGRTAGRGSI